jgi:adenylate cyclase
MTAGIQSGHVAAAHQLAQRVIELTGGKPSLGELITVSPVASALSIRGTARWTMGSPGWRADFDEALRTIAAIPPAFRSGTLWHVYVYSLPNGVLLPTSAVVDNAAEIYAASEQYGERVTVDLAKGALGMVLIYREGPERDRGVELLEELHDRAQRERPMIAQNMPVIDLHLAREKARRGDFDGAIELARNAFDDYLQTGDFMWFGAVSAILAESLLQRGSDGDIRDARDVIATLAAVPTEPGCIVYDIWLLRLRALLARAEGDESTYRGYRNRYRTMANDLGFEGHMKWSAEMV